MFVSVVTGLILLWIHPLHADPTGKNAAISGISVETLAYMRGNKDVMVVDVRSGPAFSKVRIPGAVNIPLYAVRTKMFLKNKKIVLVNEGFHRADLMEGCTALKHAGFEAHFLYGGLAAWSKKGMPLEGDAFTAHELNKINPAELFQETESLHTVLIDMSEKGFNSFNTSLKTEHFPVKKNDLTALKRLCARIDKVSKNRQVSVVLTNDTGSGYQLIEKQLSDLGAPLVYFLDGGTNGYLFFEEKHLRMNSNRNERIVKMPGCSSCGEDLKADSRLN